MSKYKIKILSSLTRPGGSTIALINLCNLFNERGEDCTFYAPNDWILSKCKYAVNGIPTINDENEILIIHNFDLVERPKKSHKVILASHENRDFIIKDLKHKFWDQIVYVSKYQMEWQGKPGIVIPNVLTFLRKKLSKLKKKAGVIGSIHSKKNTHVSIERALQDGFSKVYLYGEITEQDYYKSNIEEYVQNGEAILLGHEDDPQKIYDTLTDVYHSSLDETFNLVRAECALTGVNYHGTPSADPEVEYKSKDEIFSMWEKALDL